MARWGENGKSSRELGCVALAYQTCVHCGAITHPLLSIPMISIAAKRQSELIMGRRGVREGNTSVGFQEFIKGNDFKKICFEH